MNPDAGFKVVGRGEAAAIALAKIRGGILASNNMSDVKQYVDEYKLEHVTTGEILIEALNQNYITEDEGNTIWANMISRNRKLPTRTFTEFIESKSE